MELGRLLIVCLWCAAMKYVQLSAIHYFIIAKWLSIEKRKKKGVETGSSHCLCLSVLPPHLHTHLGPLAWCAPAYCP